MRNSILSERKSYLITVGEWFINEKGERDRLYTLERFNSEIYQNRKPRSIRSQPRVKGNSLPCNEGVRAEKIRQAKLRAKLIAVGKYNEEAEKKICGSS